MTGECMAPRHIQVLVDSLALVAGEPAERCVFLCDDSGQVAGQGSATLASPVAPGQFVAWHTVPIDLQAPAWIAGVEFGQPGSVVDPEDLSSTPSEHRSAPDCLQGTPAPAWAYRWEGYVPLHAVPGIQYPYRILLTFADGRGAPIAIAGMRLAVDHPVSAGGHRRTGDHPDVVSLRQSWDLL